MKTATKLSKKGMIALIAAAAAIVAAGVALAVFLPKNTTPGHGNIEDIDWYDESGTEFVIEDVDMLYDVVTLSYVYDFAGQTLKLGADITVNRGDAADWEKKAPAIFWEPIRNFAGTFDGQGHTINGLYAKTINEPTALFTYVQSNAVIRDFRLENSLFLTAGSAGSASIAANCAGTYQRIYSNAVVRCNYGVAGGLFSVQTGKILAEECWFDGEAETSYRNIGGIADRANGFEMVLNHCLNTGTIIDTWHIGANNAGGLVGMTIENARLVINDCFSGGKLELAHEARSGSVLGGGDSTGTATVTNTFCVLEAFEFPISTQISHRAGGAAPITEKNLTGVKAYQWTNLDFENYWACEENALPVLKCFAGTPIELTGVAKEVDYDWYNDVDDVYVISTVPQLYAFTLLSYSTDYSGKTFKLAADLKLNDGLADSWITTPPENIWYPVQSFGGIFDGQGHTISGVYVCGQNTLGLFSRTTSTCTLRNFRLENSLIHAKAASSTSPGDALSGAIVGRGGGTLDSIYTNAVVYAEGMIVGGIIGHANLRGIITNISSCWFDGKVICVGEEYGYRAGGIIGGHVLGTVNIGHCLNTGAIHTEVDTGSQIGGFVGYLMNECVLNITDSLNACTVEAKNYYYVGGAIGVCYNGPKVTITNTYSARESVYNASGEYVSHNKSKPEVSLEGAAIPVYGKYLTGKSAARWTGLNFEKFWALRTDGLPVPAALNTAEPVSAEGIGKVFNLDWYDADKGTGTIRSAADYIGFTMLSWTTDFADQTIRLGADITLNSGAAAAWGERAPGIQTIPMSKFAGTFDGQGHTISGVYQKDQITLGLFARTAETAVVRNFRLVNSYFDVLGKKYDGTEVKDGMSGTIVGRGGGVLDTIYSSAILRACGIENGGIIGQVNVEAANRFTNLWFDGTIYAVSEKSGYFAGGIAGGIMRGNNQFAHCLFTGTIHTETDTGSKAGGIIGAIQNEATASVTDCLSAGTFDCVNPYYKGAIMGTMYSKNKVTISNCFADSQSALDNNGRFVSAAKNAQVPDGALMGSATPVSTADLAGLGGYQWTTLDFDTYWAARSGACPGLKSFVSEPLSTSSTKRMLDMSWYRSSAKTLTIDSAADLYGWYVLSFSDDFSGKTIRLGADITVNSGDAAVWGTNAPAYSWTPIASFAGTLDGQGYTVSGIYTKVSSGDDIGLISVLKGGTVKNLRLVNSYIEGSDSSTGVGALAGTVDGGGTIEKVYVSATVVHSYYNNGGIAGRATHAGTVKIINCQFAGTVSGTGYNNAGIIGAAVHNETAVEIANCLMSGTVTTDAMRAQGGVIGNRMNSSTVAIGETMVSGTVHSGGGGSTGAVAGNAGGGELLTMTNVYATLESCSQGSAGIGKGSPAGEAMVRPASRFTGLDGYRRTELNFGTCWTAVESGTPVLKAFYTGAALDLTGVERIAPQDDIELLADVCIGTPQELLEFANASKSNDYAGKLVVLTADIDMTGVEGFPGIAQSSGTVFAGIFDGQGYTISHLTVDLGGNNAGLFRVLSGTASHFTLDDCTVTTNGEIAGVAVGKLTGVVSGVTVRNSSVANPGQTGGIAGQAGAGASISDCCVEESVITGTATGKNDGWIGGILGSALNGDVTVENCSANATVSGSTRVGGVVGYTNNALTVTGCTVSGTVTGNWSGDTFVGGVLGVANGGSLTATDCFVDATLVGACAVGGILSDTLGAASATLDSCVFTGTFGTEEKHVGSWAGGMMGGVEGTGGVTVSNCVSVPHSTGVNASKGTLIGNIAGGKTVTVSNCYVNQTFGWSPVGVKNGTLNGISNVKTDCNTWTITTAAQLLQFAGLQAVEAFAGGTVYLGEDIDLNPGWTASAAPEIPASVWTVTGTAETAFAGTFDGQSHTVSGLYIAEGGFIKQASSAAVIGNMTITNSFVPGGADAYMGVVVGQAGECTVSGVTVTDTVWRANAE